jgi:Big-like domain-containing protein
MPSPVRFTRNRAVQEAFTCLATALVLSCSNQEPTIPDAFLLGPPVSLEIQPDDLSLVAGTQGMLTALAFDARGHRVGAIVHWTTSDPSVATIGQYDGLVTAISVGQATITASDGASLQATTLVTVRPPNPPAELHISPEELIISVPSATRLTVDAKDAAGQPTPVTVEWTSGNPGIATVDRVTGVVTAIAVGMTEVVATAGYVSDSIPVRVEPPEFRMQWASTATASSQYASDMWSAVQATGAPNVGNCDEESNSWASANSNGMDWLELTYDEPVRPSEIRIHEVWAPGSIVKVEVRDLAGAYHTVYEATPASAATCLRKLTIPVTAVTELVNVVRLTLDQRIIQDWNEIDAVRLSGYRKE